MPRVRSAYAGGYSESVKRQLQNTRLPEKAKCDTCHKIRLMSAFSKNQLANLRNAIFVRNAHPINGPGWATCVNCVGGQAAELTCVICDRTKSLEEFAKNQRHDRDNARCLNCVQDHEEMEPVMDENQMIETDHTTTRLSSVASSRGYGDSTIGPFSRHHINVPSSARSISSFATGAFDDDEDDDASIGGGVWVDPNHDDDEQTGHKGHAFTAFDPQGIAHRRQTSPGAEVYSHPLSTMAVNARRPPLPKKDSKFAKVPGKRFEKNQAPTMRIPEPTGKTVDFEDEIDDEDVCEYI